MHRIDTKTAQKDKFGAGKNGFTRGNPQTGTPATDLDDDYFDMLQEELCSVVEASGASLEKGRHDQLLTALRALLLSRNNPFGDIKSDGTVPTALENLGLGDISATGVATGSMGGTGYAIFPMMIGGARKTFIMQWGLLTPLKSGGYVNINLPVAFPTMVMQAYATHDNATLNTRPTVYAITTTSRTTITATATCLDAGSVGATVTRSSDDTACYGRYFAIGC
ncbi:phage protein [Escherichia coli KTE233]|uniref:gp53-like domain-containing protein n=1 Tax=Escherichia coli TaxID=562 RepID=UPI0002A2FE5C|nr:phage protein [Escherichia coli KTE233]